MSWLTVLAGFSSSATAAAAASAACRTTIEAPRRRAPPVAWKGATAAPTAAAPTAPMALLLRRGSCWDALFDRETTAIGDDLFPRMTLRPADEDGARRETPAPLHATEAARARGCAIDTDTIVSVARVCVRL
jgi:hypothetical protein